MMKINLLTKLMILLLLLTAFTGKSFAYQNYENETSFEKNFEKIIDGKYYIKPGTILVSQDSIYLCVQGQMIPIGSLEVDEEGVYTPYAYKWGTCPVCHWPKTPW